MAVNPETWRNAKTDPPESFVSVLGFMTDAGSFPPVRECYMVGKAFFFPALGDIHPVSWWRPMPDGHDVPENVSESDTEGEEKPHD